MINEIIVLMSLVMFSAMFSLIESSFLSISQIKANAFVVEKRKRAQDLLKLKKNPEKLLITILIGNTMANITAVSLAIMIMLKYFPKNGAWFATLSMSAIILVFAQILPKVIGQKKAEPIALALALPAKVLIKLLFPLTYLIEKLIKLLSGKYKSKEQVTNADLLTMIDLGRKQGILDEKSAGLIGNMMNSHISLKASDVMTSKEKVVSVKESEKISTVIDTAIRKDCTRFPVTKEKDDTIIGIVSLSRLVKSAQKRKNEIVKKAMQNVLVIPRNKNIHDLLLQLFEEDRHIAVVVNEYGSFEGVVTVEDVVKKIFRMHGDVLANKMNKPIILSGDTKIEEIREKIPADDDLAGVTTIGGYIEKMTGTIPKKGEKITIGNIRFEILEATSKKIIKVRVKAN